MDIQPGMKALVTTDAFFFAPDGREYRSVFGTVAGICDDKGTLGIATNRNSTNWYLKIGGMVIAGCQIHYAVACDSVASGEIDDWRYGEDGLPILFRRPSLIYMADGLSV